MKNTLISIASLCASLYITNAVSSDAQSNQTSNEILNQADHSMINPNASPVRRIERKQNKLKKNNDQLFFRSIDGSENNLAHPAINATDTQLIRITEAGYSDQSSALAGPDRPGPREISNAVISQSESVLTAKLASDFLWQWGQFLDHDIDLSDSTTPEELAPIAIPAGDPQFDPNNTRNVTLNFNRTIYELGSNPRQQLNEITGWIDASNVYG